MNTKPIHTYQKGLSFATSISQEDKYSAYAFIGCKNMSNNFNGKGCYLAWNGYSRFILDRYGNRPHMSELSSETHSLHLVKSDYMYLK